jgi:hypothetical protein
MQDKKRGAMMRWARKEKGWKNTAQQWHEDFII